MQHKVKELFGNKYPHISRHAINRYRERYQHNAKVSDIKSLLNETDVEIVRKNERTAEIKIIGGPTIIIKNGTIVTIK